MDKSIIKYSNVTIKHDRVPVIENLNVEFMRGQYIYIVGKVGTGKSSFLKTIYGELGIDEGFAEVLGFNMRKMKQRKLPVLRKKIGIVFQDFQLLMDRTVYDNLMFVLKATGWKNKRMAEVRINEVLEKVGMPNKGYKKPNELSGGEQQRIAIARAILNKPEILIADEPTGNLDAETADAIVSLLRSISEAGTLVIITTHNLAMLVKYPGIVYECKNHKLELSN